MVKKICKRCGQEITVCDFCESEIGMYINHEGNQVREMVSNQTKDGEKFFYHPWCIKTKEQLMILKK